MCERCFKETMITTMSYFNMQMICMGCEKKEKELPKYAEAKKAENDAVRGGNYNFKGIGL